MRGLTLFAAGVCLAAATGAAPISVWAVDPSGRPIRDAVVTLYLVGGGALLCGRFAVSQQKRALHPLVTAAPVGLDVARLRPPPMAMPDY